MTIQRREAQTRVISLGHDTVKYNLLETNGIEDEIELIRLKESKG